MKKCEYIMPDKIKKLLDDKNTEIECFKKEIETFKKEVETLKAKLEVSKVENDKLKTETDKLKIEISKSGLETKANIYEKEYHAIRDKPTTTTYNNMTSNKLKLVNTSTIEPFTVETVRTRLINNEYTYDTYMSGLNGIKRFIMGIITKDDEKNYVTTDVSRPNFHRLEDTKKWIGDKGALFLNELFDEMRPKVQEHWDKFTTEMDRAVTFEDRESFDGDLERVKPIAVAIINPSSKPRKELLDDVIKHIKPRVAI